MSIEKIKGGYILKARCGSQSNIANKPPCVRETWDWLLMNANHKPKKVGGIIVSRGQLLRSYRDIREGLSWNKGYVKMTYSEAQMKDTIQVLKKLLMIDTTKLLQGMLITILNFDRFQDVANYEGYHEGYHEEHHEENHEPTSYPLTRTMNEKEEKKEKKIKKENFIFPESYSENLVSKFTDFIENRKELKKPVTKKAFEQLVKKLNLISAGNEDLAMQVLNNSIESGWSGLFPIKNSTGQRQNEFDFRKQQSPGPEYAEL